MKPRSHCLLGILGLLLAAPWIGAEDLGLPVDTSQPGAQDAPLSGVWVGTFRQSDPHRLLVYPMRLEVDVVKGPAWDQTYHGSLHWKRLQDSVTVMKGNRNRLNLHFTETRLVRGQDIVLEGHYRATFRDPDTLEGIWYKDGDPRAPGFGRFTLRRTALPRLGVPDEGWLQGP